MILGVSLVVDELNKGPRLIFSYPSQKSTYHRRNLPGISIRDFHFHDINKEHQRNAALVDKLYDQYFRLCQDNFAKLFVVKSSLAGKSFELAIDDLHFISFPCLTSTPRDASEDPSSTDEKADKAPEVMSMFNIVIATISGQAMLKINKSFLYKCQCKYLSHCGEDPIAAALGLRLYSYGICRQSLRRVLEAASNALLALERKDRYVSREVSKMITVLESAKGQESGPVDESCSSIPSPTLTAVVNFPRCRRAFSIESTGSSTSSDGGNGGIGWGGSGAGSAVGAVTASLQTVDLDAAPSSQEPAPLLRLANERSTNLERGSSTSSTLATPTHSTSSPGPSLAATAATPSLTASVAAPSIGTGITTVSLATNSSFSSATPTSSLAISRSHCAHNIHDLQPLLMLSSTLANELRVLFHNLTGGHSANLQFNTNKAINVSLSCKDRKYCIDSRALQAEDCMEDSLFGLADQPSSSSSSSAMLTVYAPPLPGRPPLASFHSSDNHPHTSPPLLPPGKSQSEHRTKGISPSMQTMLPLADPECLVQILMQLDGKNLFHNSTSDEEQSAFRQSRLCTFIEAADPTKSFLDLSLLLDEPVEDLSLMATYLQGWGLAEIIPVVYTQSVYKVHMHAPLHPHSRVANAFERLMQSMQMVNGGGGGGPAGTISAGNLPAGMAGVGSAAAGGLAMANGDSAAAMKVMGRGSRMSLKRGFETSSPPPPSSRYAENRASIPRSTGAAPTAGQIPIHPILNPAAGPVGMGSGLGAAGSLAGGIASTPFASSTVSSVSSYPQGSTFLSPRGGGMAALPTGGGAGRPSVLEMSPAPTRLSFPFKERVRKPSMDGSSSRCDGGQRRPSIDVIEPAPTSSTALSTFFPSAQAAHVANAADTATGWATSQSARYHSTTHTPAAAQPVSRASWSAATFSEPSLLSYANSPLSTALMPSASTPFTPSSHPACARDGFTLVKVLELFDGMRPLGEVLQLLPHALKDYGLDIIIFLLRWHMLVNVDAYLLNLLALPMAVRELTLLLPRKATNQTSGNSQPSLYSSMGSMSAQGSVPGSMAWTCAGPPSPSLSTPSHPPLPTPPSPRRTSSGTGTFSRLSSEEAKSLTPPPDSFSANANATTSSSSSTSSNYWQALLKTEVDMTLLMNPWVDRLTHAEYQLLEKIAPFLTRGSTRAPTDAAGEAAQERDIPLTTSYKSLAEIMFLTRIREADLAQLLEKLPFLKIVRKITHPYA